MTPMTAIVATMLSIAAIAALAWAAKRLLRAPLCPICAGVAGTWLWMAIARNYGVAIDPLMLSVLVGGSAVGLTQQLEKRLSPGCPALLWKSLFIPVVLVVAYGIAMPDWTVFFAAVALLVLLTIAGFARRGTPAQGSATVAKLEEQMKNCC